MTQTSANTELHGGRLWLIFLGGPVIYIIYFLVVWVLGEYGCLAGIERLRFFGWNPIRFGVVAMTTIATLITLSIGFISFRRWRQLRQDPARNDDDYELFMAFVGTWLNGLFTLAIVMTAIASFVESQCEFL